MSERVNVAFSRIASHYDIMNHLMSMGVDVMWRRRAAEMLIEGMRPGMSYSVLDAATGTGDLAIMLEEYAERRSIDMHITAQDFNKEMLSIAVSKAAARRCRRIRFELGDAMHMHYRSGTFDAVTSAFALRNFDSVYAFSKEAHRVLKRNGRFAFLDMAMPDTSHGRAFFNAYAVLMKGAGAFIDREAYSWLVRSIKGFDTNMLKHALLSEGFRNVSISRLATGIAFVARGLK